MKHLAATLLYALVRQCLANDQKPLHSETIKKHLALTDDLIAFHKNLTQIETITYNEEAASEWLASSLESQGYHVEKQFVDKKPGRFNIYAYPGSKWNSKVLVSSHIDTVSRSMSL